VISSAACFVGDEDGNDDNKEESVQIMQACSSVWEIKKNHKATKQLHTNMLHFRVQMTVKALKEGNIIDQVRNCIWTGHQLQKESWYNTLIDDKF